MAKSGETLDKLAVRIGLDLSELSTDFIAADKSINQNLVKLNSQRKLIQLRADVDVKSLENAGNATKALATQEEALSKQIDIQRERMKLMSMAIQQLTTDKGAEHSATIKQQMNYEKERQQLVELEAQLKKITEARKQSNEQQQKLNRLDADRNYVKLRAENDIKALNSEADAAKRLVIQEDALNKQIQIQSERMKLLDSSLRQLTKDKGANSEETKRARLNYEQERRVLIDLENELHKLTQARKNDAAAQQQQTKAAQQTPAEQIRLTSQSIIGGIGQARQAITGMFQDTSQLSNMLAMIPGHWGKIAAGAVEAMTAVYDIQKSIIDGSRASIEATDNVYRQAQRMQTSFADFAKVNKIFKLAGGDVNSFTTAMMRLNKQILQAGTSGNETTRMLELFGVSMKDANGHLLRGSEALHALGEGYRVAKENGLEMEYVTQLLGARGMELIPVLQELNELEADSDRIIKPLGIDPVEAHEMNRELRIFDQNLANLKATGSAALAPIAMELIPSLNESMAKLNATVKMVVEGLKYLNQVTYEDQAMQKLHDDIRRTAEDSGLLGQAFDELIAWAKNNQELPAFLQNYAQTMADIDDEIRNTSGTHSDAMDKAIEKTEELSAADVEAIYSADGLANAHKKQADEAEKAAERAKRAAEKEAKAYEDAAKRRAAANARLDEKMFKITHNDRENELYDLQKELNELAAEGASQQKMEQYARMREAEIYQKDAEKSYKKQQEFYDKLYRRTHNDRANAYRDLQKEISGYRNAGVDAERLQQYEMLKTNDIISKNAEARHQASQQAIKDAYEYAKLDDGIRTPEGQAYRDWLRQQQLDLSSQYPDLGIPNGGKGYIIKNGSYGLFDEHTFGLIKKLLNEVNGHGEDNPEWVAARKRLEESGELARLENMKRDPLISDGIRRMFGDKSAYNEPLMSELMKNMFERNQEANRIDYDKLQQAVQNGVQQQQQPPSITINNQFSDNVLENDMTQALVAKASDTINKQLQPIINQQDTSY